VCVCVCVGQNIYLFDSGNYAIQKGDHV